MSRTVARLLAESLEAHDVDQIYCVPGESYVGLTSELLQRNSMRVIVCRLQRPGPAIWRWPTGGCAARAGVAMVSPRGPGMANAMGPLHSAYHDATPMVVLVGQVERKDFGRLALQEQNYSRLLADTTKLVIEVNEPEQASEAIARAFHVAESGTQGPVAVILPEDIFDEETDAEVDAARDRPIAGPRVDDLNRLAEMLAASERPLVPVGGALWADHLRDPATLADLNRLAEEWVLPINPTHRRPHLFDALHPNYGGYIGIRVPPALLGEMKKADLMIALGERMTDSVSQSYTFPAAPTPQLPVRPCLASTPTRSAGSGGRLWGCHAARTRIIKALLSRGAPSDAARRRGWVEKSSTRSIAACWPARNGTRPATASTSPPSSARSTSIWRPTPSSPPMPAISAALSTAISASSKARSSCRRLSARWDRACRWRWARRCVSPAGRSSALSATAGR